jgi:hypothetical protein
MFQAAAPAFVIRPETADLSWERREEELRAWLAKVARFKAGRNATGKEIAKLLGIDPSTWSRWRK